MLIKVEDMMKDLNVEKISEFILAEKMSSGLFKKEDEFTNIRIKKKVNAKLKRKMKKLDIPVSEFVNFVLNGIFENKDWIKYMIMFKLSKDYNIIGCDKEVSKKLSQLENYQEILDNMKDYVKSRKIDQGI
jgi:hypothetical protein